MDDLDVALALLRSMELEGKILVKIPLLLISLAFGSLLALELEHYFASYMKWEMEMINEIAW
jgi:hypothetical protein